MKNKLRNHFQSAKDLLDRPGIFNLAMGVAALTVSNACLSRYSPEITSSEMSLLNGSSSYISQYQGAHPREILTDFGTTLENVGAPHHSHEKISKLEGTLRTITIQISNEITPEVYQPVLRDIAERTNKIIKEEKANKRLLPMGILLGIASLGNVACGIYKLRKTKAEEERELERELKLAEEDAETLAMLEKRYRSTA
ncbi:hypothetical protein HOD88_01285 [archaeon]|jgi:hypothetical protein|nr:hypothetical protein [archaeon]